MENEQQKDTKMVVELTKEQREVLCGEKIKQALDEFNCKLIPSLTVEGAEIKSFVKIMSN